MIDDTRRPDNEPEFDEPVFSTDEEASAENEPASGPDFSPDSTVFPEPEFQSGSEPFPTPGIEAVSSGDEPVFAADGDPVESQESPLQREGPEAPDPPSEFGFPEGDSYNTEIARGEPVEDNIYDQETDLLEAPSTGTGWVNIAPESEMPVEPNQEKEYNYFEETPAAEVAAVPPTTRKLGRTGPVWVLGGFALVAIVVLVWLGISRLTGSSESNTAAPSEPTVEQVAANAPTLVPATNTPGPTATPSPMLLPINDNVTVGDTDGQGVKLRAEPGLAGLLVEVVQEGTIMAVLAGEPDAEYDDYPVPLDGYLWYRMRVPGVVDKDGNPLVGWSASEFFVVENQ